MSDGFNFSEELVDEVVTGGASHESPASDPDRAGFSALLPVLRAARQDPAQKAVLAACHGALEQHLHLARKQLEALPMGDAVRDQAATVLTNTQQVMDRMELVLEHVGHYLEGGDAASLDQAIHLLEAVQGAVKAVMQDPHAPLG